MDRKDREWEFGSYGKLQVAGAISVPHEAITVCANEPDFGSTSRRTQLVEDKNSPDE